MDSAEEYAPYPVARPGSNWEHHRPIHYPYPSPPIPLMPSVGAYNPFSSQQIVPAPDHGTPIPPTYPPTTGFAGHSPSPPVPTESLDQLKQALQKIQELPQMADPLSLMASLIAVATAGIQVSRTLYNFAGVIGGASEEIMSIGKEISAFSGVLRDLHDFLDDAKELISKRALANANHILEDCKEIFAKIQRMLDSCNAGPRMNFWQSLQWSFRRDKVKPMCAKLESFKLTLAILLSTMRLARCKQEIGDSKSPTSSRKERRYRENLETDILNNSAAISRWQQVEIELKSSYHGYPYSPHRAAPATPSKELEWLSNLVPYKPPQPPIHPAASHFLPLPPIPETPDHLDKQAKVQIIKTVNMLLTKWTTLNAPETQRPEKSRHDSPQSNLRRTSKPSRQAVAESSDKGPAESETAPSETPGPQSTDLAAADSGGINDALETEMNRLSSNTVETSPTPIVDVSNDKDGKQELHESNSKGHRHINITFEHISHHSGDEATGNSDGSADEEEEEEGYWLEASYPRPDDTESGQSDAYSSRSIAPSESPSRPPRRARAPFRRPRPQSFLSSESYAFGPPPGFPANHATPYGAWTYRPHGPAPNLPPSYGPVPYAPSPHTHISYGPQPPFGSAQTSYDPSSNVLVPYMSPPYPRIVQGPYPGFNSHLPPQPPPQPAPLPEEPPPVRRDEQVDTLEEKVESLKKELEEMDLMNRARMEKLLEEQMAKEAARRAEEEAELAARRANAEAELRAKEEVAELAARRAKEEAELAAFEKQEKDRIDREFLENSTVRFKDAIGRKFTFPYRQCKRWVDMETLIEQAFTHVDNSKLVDHVKRGHFDLTDPSGALILPSLWETVVKPDWTVSMHMWPSPKIAEVPAQEPPPHVRPPPPLSKPVPPAVPMAPSVVIEPRSRAARREKVVVEPRDPHSHQDTDSVTESMSTDEDSDHSNRKSTYQDVLTESFIRHGQQFEETWEAVMARSRVKAQKTILEMWLSESEAELRELDPSPSREQSARGRGQKATDTSGDVLEGGSNERKVPGQENQASKELPRPDYVSSTGQKLPIPLAMGYVRDANLCQSCQSPFLLTKSDRQTPAVKMMGPLTPLGDEREHIPPQNIPPHSALEQRIETLEDLIKRQEAVRQARLDKAKSFQNEERLSRLEKAIAQTGVQTPPLTPTTSEPSPILPTGSIPRPPAPSRSGSGPASNGSRPSFRKKLFGRSISSSAGGA